MLSDANSWMVSVVGLSITCSILLLIYQVLNKRFNVFQTAENTCWCCRRKRTISNNKERISKELVNSFSYDNQQLESDSECENEDLMKQLQQPIEKISDDHYYMSKLNECLNETSQWHQPPITTPTIAPPTRTPLKHQTNEIDIIGQVEEEEDEDLTRLQERESLIRSSQGPNPTLIPVGPGTGIQRQHSICLNDENIPFDTLKNRSLNMLKQQAIYTSFALKNNSKTFEMYLANDKENVQGKKMANNDLISLAEKGRIGKQTSTDGSISSETGSAEDNILNKRNILKRLKTESSETTESKDVYDHNKYQALSNYYDNYESDTQSSNLPDFSPNATLSEQQIASSMVIKSGRLEVSFAYDAPSKRLYVTVIQGDEIPHKEQHASVCQVYVKVILLPHKKQKFRTKSKPIFCPVFDESFTFNRISPEEIVDLGLRFRVFSMGFTRKTHLIGESRLSFACMKPQQQETKLWFTLEMPSKRSRLSDLESSSLARTDSTSSQSLQNSSPEILLGLSYNGTTGRLSVTIIKGSQFRSVSTRAPDTYIKLLLISQSGNEMARGKTRVCRGQPNPLFRETFVFQVALFQLPDVTLMTFVYNKRSIKRKEMIGWISLGYNSSGDEELSHWNDMRDNKGEQVSRWHVLHEPS